MKSIVQQLDHIFKPESIAVLGASKDPIKWGNRILRHIKQGGFQGKLYPINPSYNEILNLHSYPSVLDTPDNVEMAIITLPAGKVPQAMLECVQKGIKGALIITAGFAEVGNEGKLLQNKVVEIARKGGIRFVGPNCMGIWSAAGNLNLCFREAPRPGFIAFVSQSGTYGGYLSEIANSRGYGLSKFINIGNQADISASEYLDYLVDDEDVKVFITGLKIDGCSGSEETPPPPPPHETRVTINKKLRKYLKLIMKKEILKNQIILVFFNKFIS